MFTYILVLSLLSITCGITNGEDSNQRKDALGLWEMPIQKRGDMNFFKIPRTIRAPFGSNEIMTARGFGKRSRPSFLNGEAMTARGFGKRARFAFTNGEAMTARGFGKRNDRDEDEYSNDIDSFVEPLPSEQYQRPLFPFFHNFFQYQRPQLYEDQMPKRNGIKFSPPEGGMRTARNWGKRSYFLDVEPSNSDNSAEIMKALSDQDSNQLKPKESKDEET